MTRKKIQIIQADNGLIVKVFVENKQSQLLIFESVADFGKWFAEFWRER